MKPNANALLLLTLSLSLLSCGRGNDVCIYGGSSACVTAAYSAAHEGSKVVIICPDKTIGGMTTGGLGQTDIGNKQAVIGLARQFYRKLGAHYGKLEQWLFEPHVAEEVLFFLKKIFFFLRNFIFQNHKSISADFSQSS